jgi:hypothetical protein
MGYQLRSLSTPASQSITCTKFHKKKHKTVLISIDPVQAEATDVHTARYNQKKITFAFMLLNIIYLVYILHFTDVIFKQTYYMLLVLSYSFVRVVMQWIYYINFTYNERTWQNLMKMMFSITMPSCFFAMMLKVV